MVEAGSIGVTSVVSVLFKNIGDCLIGALAWFVFGWAFAYGDHLGLDADAPTSGTGKIILFVHFILLSSELFTICLLCSRDTLLIGPLLTRTRTCIHTHVHVHSLTHSSITHALAHRVVHWKLWLLHAEPQPLPLPRVVLPVDFRCNDRHDRVWRDGRTHSARCLPHLHPLARVVRVPHYRSLDVVWHCVARSGIKDQPRRRHRVL
jgi:hypothetical protein